MTIELTREDRQQIREAEGWLVLGDHVAAFEALERVAPEHRTHSVVLKLRWQIYARAEKWGNAFTVAEGLTRVSPDDAGGLVLRSYGARRMKGGSVAQAFDLLRDVSDDSPDEPIVPFNLA